MASGSSGFSPCPAFRHGRRPCRRGSRCFRRCFSRRLAGSGERLDCAEPSGEKVDDKTEDGEGTDLVDHGQEATVASRLGGLMRARVVGIAALVVSRWAHADTDVARADTLFKQGQRLLDTGKFSEACPILAESHRLDPKLGRLLNLAFCHEQEGKAASAWVEYNDAVALAAQRDQRERAEFARVHAEHVAKKLAYLRLDFPKGKDTVAEIVVDSLQLPRDKWTVPLPVDPGKHSIVARAADHVPRALSIDIPTAPGTTALAIDPLEVEHVAAPIDTAPRADAAVEESRRPRGTFYAALVAGGLGVAGLGVGATFGGLAATKKGDADPHCPAKACDSMGAQSLADAKTFATVSTIGLIAGGALAATSLVLFLVSPKAPARKTVGVFVGPLSGIEGRW